MMDCCTRPCGERRRIDAFLVFVAIVVFAKLLLAVVRALFVAPTANQLRFVCSNPFAHAIASGVLRPV